MGCYKKSQDDSRKWTIRADGSSVQKRGEVGVVINTSEGEILKYEVQLQFPATNNEVEYEAVLTRLRIGKALGAKNILFKSDSKLVIGQIRGEYEVKEGRMQKNLKLTNQLIQEFDQIDFTQVPRSQNSEANEVARQASSEERTSTPDLKVEVRNIQALKNSTLSQFKTRAIGRVQSSLSFEMDDS